MSLARHLEKGATRRPARRDLMQTSTCFLLPETLSEPECARLIEVAEATGYADASAAYPQTYRNNDRLVLDDPMLADALFARLREALPETVCDPDGSRWALHGLNPRFRLCRYRPGQRFSIHRDGVHAPSHALQTRLTFMLYLNQAPDFRGGLTRFFPDRDPEQTPLLCVEPASGDLIVFEHSLWHDGAEVTRGRKYILRSDILFERIAPTTRQAATHSDARKAHRGYIWDLCTMPGDRLASGSRDKTIALWDIHTLPDGAPQHDAPTRHPRALLRWRAHESSILSLHCQGKSARLLSCTRSGELAIWTPSRASQPPVDDPDALTTLEPIAHARTDDGSALLRAQFLGDGRVLSSGADRRIRLWSPTLEPLESFGQQDSWGRTMLVDQRRGCLYLGDEEGQLHTYLIETGQLLARLQLHPASLLCLHQLDTTTLACGASDGSLHLLTQRDDGTPHRAHSWQAHARATRALAAWPERPGMLVSGGEDDQIIWWDTQTHEPIAQASHQDFVRCLLAGPSGDLISGSYDGELRRWSIT